MLSRLFCPRNVDEIPGLGTLLKDTELSTGLGTLLKGTELSTGHLADGVAGKYVQVSEAKREK